MSGNHTIYDSYTIDLYSLLIWIFYISAEDFLLEDARNYRYLTQGNVSCTLDDKELYQELVEAFDIMGLNAEEKGGKWPV